jgi:hypothetical protein
MTRCSRASANGSGTFSPASRRTGASSISKPSSATIETTVAPHPPWYGFASTTISRLVFSSDRKTVAMSSGIRQRRSITSSEMPSPSSSAAAASASGTVAASATTVTSLPSRATRA